MTVKVCVVTTLALSPLFVESNPSAPPSVTVTVITTGVLGSVYSFKFGNNVSKASEGIWPTGRFVGLKTTVGFGIKAVLLLEAWTESSC